MQKLQIKNQKYAKHCFMYERTLITYCLLIYVQLFYLVSYSADFSWKVLQKLHKQIYAKHCVMYERTWIKYQLLIILPRFLFE